MDIEAISYKLNEPVKIQYIKTTNFDYPKLGEIIKIDMNNNFYFRIIAIEYKGSHEVKITAEEILFYQQRNLSSVYLNIEDLYNYLNKTTEVIVVDMITLHLIKEQEINQI